MTNPSNFGMLIGRLSQDIKAFDNSDGSRKLMITIAVDNDFKSGPDKKVQTNFVQIEHYVPAGGQAYGWDRVHNGDQIATQFRVDATPYVKDGQTVYPVKLIAEGFPTFLETKAVTEKRAADKAAKAASASSPSTPAGVQSAEERIAALQAENAALAASAGKNYESADPFSS